MRPIVLVAGLEPLGLAIVERLAAAGVEVGAIAPPEAQRHARDLDRQGVRLTTGSARSAGTLMAAGLESASALVLATDSDSENVDAALTARRLRHDLPLVVRLFDEALGAYVRDTLERTVVLSMSSLAAPVFAELALHALAEREKAGGVVRPAQGRGRPRRARGIRVDRILAGTLGGLALLVIPSTVFFARALDLRMLDALYFVWTTVTTVGYGDIALRQASDAAKLVGMVLMFGGAAFVAVLFALFTDGVVTRRLDALRGRVPVRGEGHIVITGAGHVGIRVARILAERGHRVVIVERSENRHVSALRAEGHHVIMADASVDETLDLARVDTAGVVLALTDSDATNVHVALAVRRRDGGVPVVTRLVSPELSAHVSARHDALAASPLSIASEAFAGAALAAAGVVAGSAPSV